MHKKKCTSLNAKQATKGVRVVSSPLCAHDNDDGGGSFHQSASEDSRRTAETKKGTERRNWCYHETFDEPGTQKPASALGLGSRPPILEGQGKFWISWRWSTELVVCPHTVQSDTTRCGDSRVGHPGRAKHHLSILLRFQPIDSTSQVHQNNVILLLDDNALFLLGNIVL
jgi:hypothetical protein